MIIARKMTDHCILELDKIKQDVYVQKYKKIIDCIYKMNIKSGVETYCEVDAVLAYRLFLLPEIIDECIKHLDISRLCNYIYDITQSIDLNHDYNRDVLSNFKTSTGIWSELLGLPNLSLHEMASEI